jgi:hypothetical protein
VAPRFAIGADGRNYAVRFDRHTFHQSSFGVFAQLHFTVVESAPTPELVEAEYRVLFDTIPNHVGYLVIESNHRTGLKDNEAIPSILFTPDRPRYETNLTEPLTQATFLAFLRQGVRHIIGIRVQLQLSGVARRPVRHRDDTENGQAVTPRRVERVAPRHHAADPDQVSWADLPRRDHPAVLKVEAA